MPYVDLAFGLTGQQIPVDHGYSLYSCICKVLPGLHGDGYIGIHPISGALIGGRMLGINSRSQLIFRMPSERIAEVLPIAGMALDLAGHSLVVGVPDTRALCPGSCLYSRLVVIKGFQEPEAFLEAAQRQLNEIGIQGKACLVQQPGVPQANKDRQGGSQSPVLRRTIRIRDKNIVGFALRVEELNAEQSILLQQKGIGGRRRFGCGIFIVDRK